MIKKKLKDFKTIAVIQTAFIGDTVLALHLCAEIKAIHKDCKLVFVSAPNAASAVEISSDVDQVVVYDKRGSQGGLGGIKSQASALKALGVECVICLHKSLRSTILAKMCHAKYTVGFNNAALSFLFDTKVKYRLHFHEISRNRETLKAFADGAYLGTVSPKLDYKGIDLKYIDDIFDANEGTPIILAPGSVWATKKWSAQNFAVLAKLLKFSGYLPIIIGGKQDSEIGESIAKFSGGVNLCAKTNMAQSIYAISKAKAIVSNDSAPIHFAGLVGTTTLAIFGPTVPAFGFAPVGSKDLVFECDYLTCRPCAIHGGNICPVQTHDCMELIRPDMVFDKLKEIEKSCN